MKEKYPKAFKEVNEILKHVPDEEAEKIPQDMRDMFEREMDKNYGFIIDEERSLRDQVLLMETEAILANLYRDYWADPEQRAKILDEERYEMQKEELQKQNNDNLRKLFEEKNPDEINISEYLPVKVKKQKFFKRLINYIKRLLRKIK